MAPAATSAGSSAKAGAFDVSTLFVADKAAREEAGVALATATKKEGVEFLGQIGFCDAVLKVSCCSFCTGVTATFDKFCENSNLIPLTPRPFPTRSLPRSVSLVLPSSRPFARTAPLNTSSRTSFPTLPARRSRLSSRLSPTRLPRSRMPLLPPSRPLSSP